jgi:glycosyltransferase involved in cell wall biosynthesis
VAHDVATPGGMERQLGELCGGLLARGHRVVVIARSCGLPAHPGLYWTRVRVPRRPFSLAYPAFFIAGSLAVRRHREGLLHTTGAVICNRADVSTVHFCHHGFRAASGTPQTSRRALPYRVNAGLCAWMSRRAERCCFAARRTRRLVAVSDGVAGELGRFFARRGDAAIVIPNGVDRTAFGPDPQARADVRAGLDLAGDDLVALFVGGDWDRKGLRYAIEGVARADGWHLLVVGQGDVARHRELAQRCGAGERVHWVGATTQPARYYAAADAFVLPSAYEAFPLVGLEAAAAGLPLLMSRVNGVEELLDEGRNGWFVQRDGASIAERLRTLGADPELRLRMGQASRDGSARYTWGRVVDAYVKLYATLAPAAPVTTSPARR